MSVDRSTVRVRDYWQADREVQEQLIPERPGLYIWTIDVTELLKADKPTVLDGLGNVLQAVGRKHDKAVGPYYHVWVRDSRKRIRDAKQVILQERLHTGDPFGTWLAELATAMQRPFYIGMATNLRTRISDHLVGKTPLRDRAEGVGVQMLSLAVTWAAAPGLGPIEVEEPAEDEDTGGTPVDDLTPDPDEPTLAPDMDAWLKAGESLLIRLAMPMFNENQD